MPMLTILHFADAHIDMFQHGRQDPATSLPVRVMDFLKSLDTIVDCAIAEKVDLVIFAGDAYRDRSPAPTYQREWGRRIMRLSRAGIPTLLLVGNHDLSPAAGRANALESFDTLQVPNIWVIEKPSLLGPDELGGLPLQVIAIPWISRSGLVARLGLPENGTAGVYEQIVERLESLVKGWLGESDPALPVVLTAHGSVQGAVYGAERSIMLGNDLVLPPGLMRDPRLNYVALGHIHKAQDLNKDAQPPVIYPGSIERVDMGEAHDEKFFVIAHLERGKNTIAEWRKLTGIRPHIDRRLQMGDDILPDAKKDPAWIQEYILSQLPPPEQMKGAVVRLTLEYPSSWEALIHEAALREYAKASFDFSLVRRPQTAGRIRLPADQTVGTLTPLELLDLYCRSRHIEAAESEELGRLAAGLMSDETQTSFDS